MVSCENNQTLADTKTYFKLASHHLSLYKYLLDEKRKDPDYYQWIDQLATAIEIATAKLNKYI